MSIPTEEIKNKTCKNKSKIIKIKNRYSIIQNKNSKMFQIKKCKKIFLNKKKYRKKANYTIYKNGENIYQKEYKKKNN